MYDLGKNLQGTEDNTENENINYLLVTMLSQFNFDENLDEILHPICNHTI